MIRMLPHGVRTLSLICLSTATASAQLIPVRTAPVVVSEQFFTYPSELLGMGGGLAVHDSELDLFGNPAAGARLRHSRIIGTPTVYSLPANDGFGRTLPVALLLSGDRTFGAASFATQELESAHQSWWFAPVTRNSRFSHNTYASGVIGHRSSDGAIGFSASYANLESVHAVDLLYPQADAIDQDGAITDFRVGYLHDLDAGRAVEAVLVRNHVDMEHTVTYTDRRWDPVAGQMRSSDSWHEYNIDRTTTWGAHVKYSLPVAASRWRVATAFTANRKTHPKIPNYEFMSVPRDPGDSWALRFALGAARGDSISTLALDISYEPAWTYTWAEAGEPIARPAGDSLPVGAITIENDFAFSNTNFHVGWLRRLDEHFALQLGLGFRRVNYWLDQYNHITELPRQQDESWLEMTATWGLTLNFNDFEVRYFGRRSGGGLEFGMADDEAIVAPTGPDIVAAPSGPLNMDVTTVHTHQLGIAVPFGARR